jgi:hypothetical protein
MARTKAMRNEIIVERQVNLTIRKARRPAGEQYAKHAGAATANDKSDSPAATMPSAWAVRRGAANWAWTFGLSSN